MKVWLLLVLIFVCCLLAGCPSYSLYPLYTAQDKIAVPALEGTWIDTSSDTKGETTFQKSGDQGYTMIVDDPSTKVRQTYDVHLVRLGDQLFLDLAWSNQTLNGVKIDAPAGVVATHVIWKIEISENDLGFAELDSDAIKKQGGLPGGSRLEYESGGEVLITASTDDLRRYVTAHAADAFSDSGHLKRKKPQSPK